MSTLITYSIEAHYHSESIDVDFDSLRKSFSVLALLAPPHDDSDEYMSYVNASKNVSVDRMLDQPEEKRALMRKDIFIKGRQETLNEVISFVANIIVYTRFWVELSINDTNDSPMIIQMVLEIADFLSSPAYKIFDNRYKQIAPYMYHTLVGYIFNIFSTFIKLAKNPYIIRQLKIENLIDPKDIKIGQMMFKTLLDQLQLCSATSSLQILFAHPTFSYNMFCSQSKKNDKKRQLTDKDKNTMYDNKKNLASGSIINTTGTQIMFPKGMDKRYCANFLDTNAFCKHGRNCKFIHALFPSGFTEKDKELMTKHVKETKGLSFKDKNVS